MATWIVHLSAFIYAFVTQKTKLGRTLVTWKKWEPREKLRRKGAHNAYLHTSTPRFNLHRQALK